MKGQTEDLYLDLLKKTLSFTLWPEPPVPLETFNEQRRPFKRFAVSVASRILKTKGLHLVKEFEGTEADRESGRVWSGYAHTMIGLKRLDHLQYCVETVLREGMAGDLMEAGAWRGGACILMRGVLAAYGVQDRKVYVADSFAGLPKPDVDKYAVDREDKHHTFRYLSVSQEEVAANFRRFGLLDDQVVFLKGWFEDTLLRAPVKQLALLRLDGDMYGSTIVALRSLYSKLSPAGFCIIDDYSLDGCRRAVDDFRAEAGIRTRIEDVDWTCKFWRKE